MDNLPDPTRTEHEGDSVPSSTKLSNLLKQEVRSAVQILRLATEEYEQALEEYESWEGEEAREKLEEELLF